MKILIEVDDTKKVLDAYARKVYEKPIEGVIFPQDVYISVKLVDVFHTPKSYESKVFVYEVKECVKPIMYNAQRQEWMENDNITEN